MASDRKDQLSDISLYPPPPPRVQYEVRTLPLQSEVGQVRKAACHYYSIVKARWNEMRLHVSSSYNELKNRLSDYGITRDSYVVQGGSVGGAMLLGYLLARKRPLWRRITYPVIGAVIVGEVFYLSVPENRNQINNDMKELIRRVWSK